MQNNTNYLEVLMAQIPINIYKTEIDIKKSKFIGIGIPIESPEHAREILKNLKKEYPDSRHVCYAFVWGKGSTHMGMSDDGEPNGTAGRPMLEVVKGSGYENFLVAAIRFFGGIKLGTGGLVKAYTEITQLVSKGIEVEEYVETQGLKINVPYNLYDSIKAEIVLNKGKILSEEFLSEISISFEVPKSKCDSFKLRVTDISKGSLKCINL